jgi:hypothetical protein
MKVLITVAAGFGYGITPASMALAFSETGTRK